eukprot:330871-Amphidinium_carterae.1
MRDVHIADLLGDQLMEINYEAHYPDGVTRKGRYSRASPDTSRETIPAPSPQVAQVAETVASTPQGLPADLTQQRLTAMETEFVQLKEQFVQFMTHMQRSFPPSAPAIVPSSPTACVTTFAPHHHANLARLALDRCKELEPHIQWAIVALPLVRAGSHSGRYLYYGIFYG